MTPAEFEQEVIFYNSTIKGMVKAILNAVDSPMASPELSDSVSNLAIGLLEFIYTKESSFLDEISSDESKNSEFLEDLTPDF
jgi:hypothetical protein